MALQLATILLVLISKQGMAMQPINTPTTGYKADQYVTKFTLLELPFYFNRIFVNFGTISWRKTGKLCLINKFYIKTAR